MTVFTFSSFKNIFVDRFLFEIFFSIQLLNPPLGMSFFRVLWLLRFFGFHNDEC